MDPAAARDALEAERARIERDLASLLGGHGGDARDSADRLGAGGDDAAETFADELDEGLEDDLRAGLAEVDAALARIADGSYGRCADCGAEIPAKRLEALPASARCMDCQRAAEHR